MQACREKGVDCIVAPYEADAQLAYLMKTGITEYTISEDSDLLVYGCEKVCKRSLIFCRILLRATKYGDKDFILFRGDIQNAAKSFYSLLYVFIQHFLRLNVRILLNCIPSIFFSNST